VAQYDNARALALRLITKFGELSTIQRRSDTIPDSTEPWNRTAAETGYQVRAVWLEAELGRELGTVVEAGDQIVYVAASGLAITPTAATDQIVRADGTRFSITHVRQLKPGAQYVMFELVVRQ
jgi:hypothetical protein